jgi:hypothetical protein
VFGDTEASEDNCRVRVFYTNCLCKYYYGNEIREAVMEGGAIKQGGNEM